MKQHIYIYFLLFLSLVIHNNSFAQSEAPPKITSAQPVLAEQDSNEIAVIVDQRAELPPNFRALLVQRIRYPSSATDAEISGRVTVEFIVEKDGSITNVKTIGPKMGYGLEEEAIRVMKTMPKFKPAMQNGKLVRSKFKQPIVFKLN